MSFVDTDIGGGITRRTVTGADGVDACWMFASGPDNNYSATARLYYGPDGIAATLMRIASAALPAGTIVGCRFKVTTESNNTNNSFNCARLVDANAGWVAGANDGVPEVGKVCWGAARFGEVAWVGLAGASQADVDYVTPALSRATDSAPARVVVEVPVDWATRWRDVANGGVRLWNTEGGWYPYLDGRAASDSATWPEVQIDFTAAPSGPSPAVLAYHRRRRSRS